MQKAIIALAVLCLAQLSYGAYPIKDFDEPMKTDFQTWHDNCKLYIPGVTDEDINRVRQGHFDTDNEAIKINTDMVMNKALLDLLMPQKIMEDEYIGYLLCAKHFRQYKNMAFRDKIFGLYQCNYNRNPDTDYQMWHDNCRLYIPGVTQKEINRVKQGIFDTDDEAIKMNTDMVLNKAMLDLYLPKKVLEDEYIGYLLCAKQFSQKMQKVYLFDSKNFIKIPKTESNKKINFDEPLKTDFQTWHDNCKIYIPGVTQEDINRVRQGHFDTKNQAIKVNADMVMNKAMLDIYMPRKIMEDEYIGYLLCAKEFREKKNMPFADKIFGLLQCNYNRNPNSYGEPLKTDFQTWHDNCNIYIPGVTQEEINRVRQGNFDTDNQAIKINTDMIMNKAMADIYIPKELGPRLEDEFIGYLLCAKQFRQYSKYRLRNRQSPKTTATNIPVTIVILRVI
ncbi:unnamed protein product [Diabrotica balteata]|uniref:Uncharacterized protein n=1 Tax=Diabrotica balteata TaxID=107213 RepID=A0A9N9TCJ8_DIABA|nr:unnamed protein product [Diabrotica balteata]